MDTAFYDTDFFIRGGSAELEEAGHRRPGYNNTFRKTFCGPMVRDQNIETGCAVSMGW